MSKVVPVEWIQREKAYGAIINDCNLTVLANIPAVGRCYNPGNVVAGYNISPEYKGCKYFINSSPGYVDLLEEGSVVETDKSITIFLPSKDVCKFGSELALELYKVANGFEDLDITDEMKPYVDCYLSHEYSSDIFYAVIYQAMKDKERGDKSHELPRSNH